MEAEAERRAQEELAVAKRNTGEPQVRRGSISFSKLGEVGAFQSVRRIATWVDDAWIARGRSEQWPSSVDNSSVESQLLRGSVGA